MKKNQSNIILTSLEQLLSSAIIGSNYAKNEYDKNRYLDIIAIAKKLYGQIDGFEKIDLGAYFESRYITPQIGVNGIILNENNEILLEKRVDDNCWGIPCGWAELGYSAEENLIREIKEETGFDILINELLQVVCRTPTEYYPYTSYHIIYRCEIVGGTLAVSHESVDVTWKKIEDVESWHFDHKSRVEQCLGL